MIVNVRGRQQSPRTRGTSGSNDFRKPSLLPRCGTGPQVGSPVHAQADERAVEQQPGGGRGRAGWTRPRGTPRAVPAGLDKPTNCRLGLQAGVEDPRSADGRPRPLATGKAPVLLFDEAVGKTPGEPAGSIVRVGSESGQLVRRAETVHREGVAHGGCEVHLRKRAAGFLERLFPTASDERSTGESALGFHQFSTPWSRRAAGRWLAGSRTVLRVGLSRPGVGAAAGMGRRAAWPPERARMVQVAVPLPGAEASRRGPGPTPLRRSAGE
jgi:hypothetical protein